jgi:hypothetical protein
MGISNPAGGGPDLAQVQDAVQAYKVEHGRYPKIWSLWSKWGERGGKSDCVRGYGTCAFPKAAVTWLHSKNITPMIWWIPTWPGNWEAGKYERYKRILRGKHDAYITRWAKDLRNVSNRTGKPVIVRWAHESLGNWFPWSVQNFDNSKTNYKQAFRYLSTRFKKLGAKKARFMWAQVSANPSGYPGDAYVHFVGITILNFGGDKWRDPKATMDLKAGKARKLTRKPVIFAEVGAGPAPGPKAGQTKARWITQAYNRAYFKHPTVKGLVYLDTKVNNHPDWSLDNPDSALEAYRALIAQKRFRGNIK